jgi:hypothetical protein
MDNVILFHDPLVDLSCADHLETGPRGNMKTGHATHHQSSNAVHGARAQALRQVVNDLKALSQVNPTGERQSMPDRTET